MKFRKFLAVFLAAVCMMSIFSFNVSAADEEILGDVNGDGILSKEDAKLIVKHYNELLELNVEELEIADVNADGNVNEDDAIYLLRHVLFPDMYPLHPTGN